MVKRAAAMMNWQSRPSPSSSAGARLARGRGFSYVHYKHNESLVAIGMEVAVERDRGVIHVERVVCAHDCGLVINPDAVKAQVEGNIIQTLSRALYEEVQFDHARVTSLDWASYPILTFSEVPAIEIELIDRRHEPPLGAGKPRPRLSRPRSAMPCSTRPACSCARFRSRPSESRPHSSARARRAEPA